MPLPSSRMITCTEDAARRCSMHIVPPRDVWSSAFFTMLPSASVIHSRSHSSVSAPSPERMISLPSPARRYSKRFFTASVSAPMFIRCFENFIVPESSFVIFSRFCTRVSIRSSSLSERSEKRRTVSALHYARVDAQRGERGFQLVRNVRDRVLQKELLRLFAVEMRVQNGGESVHPMEETVEITLAVALYPRAVSALYVFRYLRLGGL